MLNVGVVVIVGCANLALFLSSPTHSAMGARKKEIRRNDGGIQHPNRRRNVADSRTRLLTKKEKKSVAMSERMIRGWRWPGRYKISNTLSQTPVSSPLGNACVQVKCQASRGLSQLSSSQLNPSWPCCNGTRVAAVTKHGYWLGNVETTKLRSLRCPVDAKAPYYQCPCS